jgi:hypothetical protein
VPNESVSNREAAQPSRGTVESFLIQYIRTNPGVRFGAISRAAQVACRVSRATITRHLSRLVLVGDVTLAPGRTYVVPDLTMRPTMEDRFYHNTICIRADGSSREMLQQEFRVVSGEIGHLEFIYPKRPRQVTWWCTAPAHLNWISPTRNPSKLSIHRIEFESPLVARMSGWQRFFVNIDHPRWYRMVYDPRTRVGSQAIADERAHESEGARYLSEALRLRHRLSPDVHLRLQVVFPGGYPVGPARCRVRIHTDLNQIDSAEESRLAKLAENEWHQDGLRRLGSTLTLSVPRPKLDRRYEIVWTLPTTAQLNRWLKVQRRHGTRGPSV